MNNLTLQPIRLQNPSRWSYSYDGEFFVAEEHHPGGRISLTLDMCKQMFPDAECEALPDGIRFKAKMDDLAARATLIGEALTQAASDGLVSLSLQGRVLESIINATENRRLAATMFLPPEVTYKPVQK